MAQTPAAELEWKMVWDGKEVAMSWGEVGWNGRGVAVAWLVSGCGFGVRLMGVEC